MTQLFEPLTLGAEYLQAGKYSEAIALYQKSICADPTLTSNYWHLGLAQLLQGRESEARSTWNLALTKGNSEQVKAWIAELIDILEAEAQRRETIRDIEGGSTIRRNLYKIAPKHLNNLLAMILLAIELEVFETDGRRALIEATKLISSGQTSQVNTELIIQILKKLLERHLFYVSLVNFFEACLGANLLDSDLDRISEIKSTFAILYNREALRLHKNSQFGEAIAIFNKALKFVPDSCEVLYNLGLSIYFEGIFGRQASQLDEAEIVFNKVLEINPNFELAREIIPSVAYGKIIIEKEYKITTDCFTPIIGLWEKYLKRFVNLPIKALEIGSWEGISACWLLDNILRHESARITCIDTFEGVSIEKEDDREYRRLVEKRFDYNIAKTGASQKVQKLVGKSQEVMRSLPLNSYDLVYIDGSHIASDVLEDAILSWRLVKVGGAIVFDDYHFIWSQNPNWNPKLAIDAFLTVFQEKIQVIDKGERQVMVEKIAD